MEKIDLSEHEQNMLANPDDFTGEDFYQVFLKYEDDENLVKAIRKRKAIRFLIPAFKKKHAKATFILSKKSLDGDAESGIPQNIPLSVNLLKSAVGLGSLDAAFTLSSKLYHGSVREGIEKNVLRSSHWLRISAGYEVDDNSIEFYSEDGSPEAKLITAMKYLHRDDGFPENKEHYLTLIMQSAQGGKESGNKEAQEALFFTVMKAHNREDAEKYLSPKEIRKIQEQLTTNLPSHHPIAKTPLFKSLTRGFNCYKTKNRFRYER
jgi:TPR repeat protein